jgi:hypothetical protein
MKKLNCMWAMGVCVPLAALIMFICRKVLGFEEMEEVKAAE